MPGIVHFICVPSIRDSVFDVLLTLIQIDFA